MTDSLQLTFDFRPTVEPECPFCGDEWELQPETIYGCDVYQGDGDRWLTWSPCCLDARDEVVAHGFEYVHGVTVEAVARLITGEAVKLTENGDSAVVAPLRIVNPTIVRDGKPGSRRGWFTEVAALVTEHHRHNKAPQGHKYSVAVHNGPVRVGVAVVGRPVARHLDDGTTLEVTRLCTWGHSALRFNGASKLYAAVAAQARKLGVDRLVTYTLAGVESGNSLQAAGWTPTNVSTGTGGRGDGRAKTRWERGITKRARRDIETRRIRP